jgi:hypothetical protein
MTYSNGAVYEGEWKDGKKNGHGKYIYEDVAENSNTSIILNSSKNYLKWVKYKM